MCALFGRGCRGLVIHILRIGLQATSCRLQGLLVDEAILFNYLQLEACSLQLLTYHFNNRHNHLFQTDTPMLKGISVVIHVMIVIVGVTEKPIFFCENIG